MRVAALTVALVIVVMGVAGLVAPDSVMALRREYVVNARGMYAVGPIRVAMGLLFILVAPASRMPRAMRVLGQLVCVQGLVQVIGLPFVGPERSREILEWEASLHPALLRVGALVALAIGLFVVYAVRPPGPEPEA